MFIPLKHKFSFWVAITILCVLVILTLAACMTWGIKTGLTLGLLAFLILGGFDAAWYMLTRRHEQRIDEAVQSVEIEKSYSGSENNPTIR